MNRKIPPEAFLYYVNLGPTRTYEAVAEHYGVSRRGVADFAKRERWQERLAELDERARERTDSAALESITTMNERHLKIAKFMQGKGLEALQSGKMELLGRATRALSVGIELERLVRGEPTERVDNMEHIARRECERWLIKEGVSEAELRKGSAHTASASEANEPSAGDPSEPEAVEPEPAAEPTDATG
ncbi:MAG: hypothetical protein HUU28_08020 [Planctomycetaceae bacterium]|nr:hypothetical protein [Planctomycetaceae bacterium]